MFGIEYLFVYFFLVVLLMWWKDTMYSNIPGPRGFPILGSVPEMLYRAYRGIHLERVKELFETYGDVVQVGLMGIKRLVFICDSEDIKHLFQSPIYQKGKDANEVMADIFGNGIFNTDGENWRVQRQTASSLFHFNNLQAFVPVFLDRAHILNSILSKHAKYGEPVDLQKLFMRYTIDSIGELGYGISIDALKENKEALDFCTSFDYVQAETSVRFLLHPWWRWLPHSSFNSHIKNVDTFMKNIVDKRKKEVEEGMDISERHDLLSKFLLSKDENGNPAFDDKYLLDVLKNFLIAGRDTTALCLTWTFYLISQHPKVEKRLLEEIETVTRGGEVKHEHLKDLKYMKQVIDESLRLYPPIPMDERTPSTTDTLPSGKVIPAGTLVIYPTYAIHRLAKYWTDPDEFNPDRWVKHKIKAGQFVPFHGGPRVCLGQNMAYVEMKVVLCAVLPLFKFKVVDPSKIRYSLSLSLPATYGMEMHVTARK